jgi:aminoglycoside phosphotransferase (APT) family kinase protein
MNAGWDNTLWRLGDGLLVRLPRREVAAGLARNEHRWLPELAPRLPLPVPDPVRIGRPGGRYRWPWSVVPLLPGSPGDRTPVTDPEDSAVRLGRFLRALHQVAPDDAPDNPYRNVPLADRTDVDDRIDTLASEIDADATRRIWDQALTARPWDGPRVWLHGDLHPANTLVADGTLTAVIDFGDLCGGDPATDLAGAWMMLPPPVMGIFNRAYGGVDTDLERRSLGWAVIFGLSLLEIGLKDRPTYERVGRTTLDRVIRHSRSLPG